MKIQKLSLGVVTCIGAVTLLSACDSYKRPFSKKATQDCSALFETRYLNGENVAAKKKGLETASDASKPATECKVLEVKLDNNVKCEIVGSDKIDSLSKVLSENKNDRIILITPEEKIRDLTKIAQKYLSSTGVDVSKYFDSDIFKNMNFAYKGMRCNVSGKDFVLWTGDNRVILTVGGL